MSLFSYYLQIYFKTLNATVVEKIGGSNEFKAFSLLPIIKKLINR